MLSNAVAMLHHLVVSQQLSPAAPTWPGIRQLRPGESLTLGLPEPLRMTCMLGRLRVSEDEDSSTACELDEGQTYCRCHARQLLVTALVPSTVVLAPAPSEPGEPLRQ